MLILRPIAVLLIMLFVSLSTLTACVTSQPHLLSPNDIAKQVGTHYGDPHAQINGEVMSTETDNPPHDPMYIMGLAGNFHKGSLVAHTLGFSALATKFYVWNIYAYDQAGNEVWHDLEVAPAPR